MKNYISILLVTLFLGLSSISCEEYLDVPPDATLTEDFIFSSYPTYQGFIDNCYEFVVDPNNYTLASTANMATESISSDSGTSTALGLNCDYYALGQNGRSVWQGSRGPAQSPLRMSFDGLYDFWGPGCRIANIALANIGKLEGNATEDEINKIKGQALFFRAYLNFSVMCAYGSVPYLDQVYTQDNVKLPRFYTDEVSGKKNYQAASEKAARDLREAADLLPAAWPANELGRITKGACLGLLTKVLLYAGSPLMEETTVKDLVSDGDTGYNKEYMTRAAEAAAELIKMPEHSLTPYGNFTGGYLSGNGYRRMFSANDNSNVPYTSEIIFKRWVRRGSRAMFLFRDVFVRSYVKGPLALPGNLGGVENPLIQFMDKFEMNDGTQYKPGNSNVGGYDDNKKKFFQDRDPRFDFNYYLHDEKVGAYTCSFENQGKNYASVMRGPFMMTKFWHPNVDNINQDWGTYLFGTPLIRLADIYLMYAEAVFEATGDVDASIGGGPTARQALNIVRKRVNMPDYNPATYAVARAAHGELSSDHPFRSAVRNERAVELAYEGHLWWDMRRWKRLHKIEKNVYILDFNKQFTTVSRVFMQTFPFELRHYWLPFPVLDTQIYEGFPQNPGW